MYIEGYFWVPCFFCCHGIVEIHWFLLKNEYPFITSFYENLKRKKKRKDDVASIVCQERTLIRCYEKAMKHRNTVIP